MKFLSVGTIDKIHNLLSGVVHVSLPDKPRFLYTALRHFIKYAFKLDLKPREMELTMHGHRFLFKEFTGEIGMFHQIFVKNIYRSHEDFFRIGRPGGVIFDVGANIGMFTVDICDLNADCNVYCFEPNADVFGRLKKNVELNNLTGVRFFNVGLADKVARGYLSMNESTVLGRVTFDGKETDQPVELTTLDEFISGQGIDRVDLMKVDVEGFELLVLKGLQGSFHKVDRIIMECSRDLEKEIIELLGQNGFELKYALPDYFILYFQNTALP